MDISLNTLRVGQSAPKERNAQRMLASEITELVHGSKSCSTPSVNCMLMTLTPLSRGSAQICKDSYLRPLRL